MVVSASSTLAKLGALFLATLNSSVPSRLPVEARRRAEELAELGGSDAGGMGKMLTTRRPPVTGELWPCGWPLRRARPGELLVRLVGDAFPVLPGLRGNFGVVSPWAENAATALATMPRLMPLLLLFDTASVGLLGIVMGMGLADGASLFVNVLEGGHGGRLDGPPLGSPASKIPVKPSGQLPCRVSACD